MNDQPSARPRGITRRQFVQGTALAGFAAFLAACTGTKASSAPGSSAAAASSAGASARPVRRGQLHPDRQDGDRSAQVRELAGLHRPGDRGGCEHRRAAGRLVEDARELQEEVQRRGRLRGEDRRQPRLLRDHPARPRRRPADRLGPHRHDRLDGRQDHRPRLGGEARPGRRPQRRQEPAGPAPEPGVGPEQRLPLPVAVGHDRHRVQLEDPRREQHRPADQDRRPVGHPGRQGDDADRGSRHVRPGAAQARHRPEPRDRHRRRPRRRRGRHPAAR